MTGHVYQKRKELKWPKSFTPSTVVLKDRSSYSKYYILKLIRLVRDGRGAIPRQIWQEDVSDMEQFRKDQETNGKYMYV